jgi:hypothetical protein
VSLNDHLGNYQGFVDAFLSLPLSLSLIEPREDQVSIDDVSTINPYIIKPDDLIFLNIPIE